MFYDRNNPNDVWNQKLKKASKIMMYWINKMLKTDSEQDSNKNLGYISGLTKICIKIFLITLGQEMEQMTEGIKSKPDTFDKECQVDIGKISRIK